MVKYVFILPLLVLLVSICFAEKDEAAPAEHIVIETNLGSLKGLKERYKDTEEYLYKFIGIRYGKSPAKLRRFRKPKAEAPWTGTYDATEYGASCHQFVPEYMELLKPEKVDEDCLFLNVFVPKTLKPKSKRSVMVWIHGGALVNGNADIYDGSKIAMLGDVIFVSMNYRLGIFGFFALNDPAALGNYGLWDQKLALRWVHDNIESFGGDPNSVTIFGESAGGWSVSFQSLIPSNEGLFQRVISQSGVVGRAGLLNEGMINDAFKRLADKVNCPTEDLGVFTDCLRLLPAEELLEKTNIFDTLSNDYMLMNTDYQPAIDGELYPEHPLVLLSDSSSNVYNFFRSLDFIAGTTSNEGNLVPGNIHQGIQSNFGFNVTEGIPSKFVCSGMIGPYVKTFFDDDEKTRDALCNYYTTDASADEQSLLVTLGFADLSFVYPSTKMLEMHAGSKKGTYQYLFSRESKKPLNIVGPMPAWYKGVGHAEELQYQFTLGSLPIFKHADLELTPEEEILSRTMIKYWTNFAKTGNPNSDDNIKWEEFDTKGRKYIDLDLQVTLKSSFRTDMISYYDKNLLKLAPRQKRDEL